MGAAVVEVGLLGRWDATNVVDGTVAVLTNVGMDHTDGAAGWRGRVAAEKAGIVKPAATFVLGETDPALAEIFADTPAGAIWRRDVDFGCTTNALAVGGRVLDLRTPGGEYEQVFLPLHGPHQGDNAAIALAAVEAFFDRPIDPDLVAEAFAAVRNPGRFEIVGRDPLVVLDGAHNVSGAEAVATTLDEGFAVVGERHLVIGMLAGRDPRELLEVLGARDAAEVVCCTPGSPRALPAEDLAAIVREVGGSPRVVPEVGDAVREAVAAAETDDVVLVAGSLYTVGAARTACRSIPGLTIDR
jgi:dihydrofolate synthase/folylpolyglutamate synthase